MNENLKPVEKLTPFTKMIMTIGTLPSSFYASMSYYESMVWLYEYLKNEVIPAVNNNGEAVEELQTAFTTLKTWIENYFDNLDVQEEVNKKLDEMAEDGTLTNLIKGYIDPIYQAYEVEIEERLDEQIADLNEYKSEINSSVEEINNKVESATSGSPKGAYATLSDLETADPDHSYIYVVAETGKWYYYDTTTSEWTEGGTYQSSIDLDDVSLLKTKVNTLDTLKSYTINEYFTTFTQGRVTSSFNSSYAYSNHLKYENMINITFDDTKYKLLIFKTDSEGVYQNDSTGWLTSSPAILHPAKQFSYFGVEIATLDASVVDSSVITDLLDTTYITNKMTLLNNEVVSENNDNINGLFNSLNNLTYYNTNKYFDSIIRGRVTYLSSANSYAYTNPIKNNHDNQIIFDDTNYNVIMYETDKYGVFTGRYTGAWITSSPYTIPDNYQYDYYGLEIKKLDNTTITPENIETLKSNTYIIEQIYPEIVKEVNENIDDIDSLNTIVSNHSEILSDIINIPYADMFQRIAAVGDSLISGVITDGSTFNVTNYNESWANYISKKLHATFSHYSYGGATCKSWLNSAYKTQLENDTKSNIYFLALGTNDKNQSEYDIGNINDLPGSNSFVGYYKQIISTIHTKNPNAIIFCVSMYDNRSISNTYSNMVSSISNLYDYCYYIDFIGNTEHTSKDNDLYSSDSHFTSVGYVYVANVIYKLINSIVNDNLNNFKYFGVNNII